MSDGKTAYLRLYETLREEILSGALGWGERLPSRRQLTQEYGLSGMTVEHSLELLCQEGYAEARPRSGLYVIYRETDGFARPETAEAQPLYAADPPAEKQERKPERKNAEALRQTGLNLPFPTLARAMRWVLTEYGERILEKSPNTGLPELREALCRYLGRNRGIRVTPEQIVIGSGAEYLYGLVVELLGTKRIYGIEDPSYEKIRQVYQARQVTCDPLKLGKDGIRSGELRRTEASVLHISPFRSYPTGITASASKRQEYLRWAGEGDRFVVEDDYESEFSLLRKPEDTLFARADRQNVLYLNTFSRTISPSMRVGYMVLPESLRAAFQDQAGFYSCTVPTFEQYVILRLLDSGEFERHINRVRRQSRAAYSENKDAD